MPANKNISLNNEDGIGILTINRQDKLNALNNATLIELKEAVQEVYDSPAFKALIITGAGEKAFVAGADIREIAELNELKGRKFSENGQEIFDLIENCHKPVIAAINGFALGGGCELALSCHMRLASKNARIGLPEVTLGLLPGYGGTQRLTKLIGKGRSFEMILTGEMITAEKAYQIGLVNNLVDTPGDLLPLTIEIQKKIMKNAPLSIGMAIEAVNGAFRNDIDGYQLEANCFSSLIKTKDFGEGTNAFLEKRNPDFRGE